MSTIGLMSTTFGWKGRSWGRLALRRGFGGRRGGGEVVAKGLGVAAVWPLAVLWAWLGVGCGTPDINSGRARPDTGYIDFHAGLPGELCWEVSRQDVGAGKYRRVYSSLKPPAEGVLRLAFNPGVHRLRLTFLNRVVLAPAEVEVGVRDGEITPVRVTLTDEAGVAVQTKEVAWGPTARGRYGRRNTAGSEAAVLHRLVVTVDPPEPYHGKR